MMNLSEARGCLHASANPTASTKIVLPIGVNGARSRRKCCVVRAEGKAASEADVLISRPQLRKPANGHVDDVALSRPGFVRADDSLRSLDSLEDMIRDAEADMSKESNGFKALSKFSGSFLGIIDDKIFRPREYVEMLRGLSHVANLSGVRVHECPNSRKLLMNIAAQMDTILQSFSAEEMSWLFHACASFGPSVVSISTMEMSMSVLLCHMCLQAELILVEMDPSDVSRLVRALGTLNYRTCAGLLESLVYHVSPGVKRGEYHPRCMASIVWGLGRLQFTTGPMLVRALCTESKRRMKEFTTHDIVMFVWGLSQLSRHYPMSVIEAAHEEVCARMTEFTCSDVINLTFAFTRLSFFTGKTYMDRLASRVQASSSDMSGTDWSKFVYSCGVQGHALGPLTSIVKEHFKSCNEEYKISDAVSLLWALALCDNLDLETFSDGLLLVDFSTCSASMKVQIYQCIIHLNIVNNEIVTEETVPSEFADECRRSWLAEKARRHCLREKEAVMSSLETIGYTCDCSASLWNDAALIACLAKNAEGRSVVVEVSYPQQFFVNNHKMLLQTNEWFLKMYQRMGHKILRLREDHWNQVPEGSRSKHLQVKLDQIFDSS